jgi:hypothetical protein
MRAPLLPALENNRSVLTERFNRELLGWQDFQRANGYSSQTLMLGAGASYAVRANMRVPVLNAGAMWDWESKPYDYSRRTTTTSRSSPSVVGPGYSTSSYEWRDRRWSGSVGIVEAGLQRVRDGAASSRGLSGRIDELALCSTDETGWLMISPVQFDIVVTGRAKT